MRLNAYLFIIFCPMKKILALVVLILSVWVLSVHAQSSIEIESNNLDSCWNDAFRNLSDDSCINKEFLRDKLSTNLQQKISWVIITIRWLLSSWGEQQRMTYYNFLEDYAKNWKDMAKRVLAEYLYWFTEDKAQNMIMEEEVTESDDTVLACEGHDWIQWTRGWCYYINSNGNETYWERYCCDSI